MAIGFSTTGSALLPANGCATTYHTSALQGRSRSLKQPCKYVIAPLQVKISQPIAENGSKWESFSKFKLSGWMSKARFACLHLFQRRESNMPSHFNGRALGGTGTKAYSQRWSSRPAGLHNGISSVCSCQCRRQIPAHIRHHSVR